MSLHKSLRRLAWLSSLALSLAACKTLDNATMRVQNETYETVPGRFIDSASLRRLPDRPGMRSAQQLAEMSQSLVRKRLPHGEALEAYSQEIIDKILAQYPGEKRPVRVIVTTGSALQAEASPSGDIDIPQGVFLNVESEDELAFILAHETSHLLLNHHAQDDDEARWREVRAAALGCSAVINELVKGKAAPSGRNDAINWITGAYLAAEIVDKHLLSPAWKRTQEDEADMLGLDLMKKAGYNGAAANTVIERLTDQERHEAEAHRQEQQKLQQAAEAEFAKGDVNKGLKQMIATFEKLPQLALTELARETGRTHSMGDARENQLSSYMLREFGGEPVSMSLETARFDMRVFKGPALRSLNRQVLIDRSETLTNQGRLQEAEDILNRLLAGPKDTDPAIRLKLFDIYQRLGNYPKAVEQLEIAIKDREAPEPVFTLLLALYQDSNQPLKALTTLDLMERRFPRLQNDDLPLRMRLLKTSRRDAEAKRVYDRCLQLIQRPDLIASCQQVATT